MADGAATKEIMSANSSIIGMLLPYLLAILPSIPSDNTANRRKMKENFRFGRKRMEVIPNKALSMENESALDNLFKISLSIKMPREGVEPSTLRSSAVRSPN